MKTVFRLAMIAFVAALASMVGSLIAWPFLGVWPIYPILFGSWMAMLFALLLMLTAAPL